MHPIKKLYANIEKVFLYENGIIMKQCNQTYEVSAHIERLHISNASYHENGYRMREVNRKKARGDLEVI